MRSFVSESITIPVAFKASRHCRRAQLWNRQASIIMDLTMLALRQIAERHRNRRCGDLNAKFVGMKIGALRLDDNRFTPHRTSNDRIDG